MENPKIITVFHLENLHFGPKWFLKKTALKTKSLYYRPGFIDLLGNQVEVVTEFKLLGVTIDEKLTFEPHVKLLRAKVTQKLFALKSFAKQIPHTFPFFHILF
jgi:hypothetical protein